MVHDYSSVEVNEKMVLVNLVMLEKQVEDIEDSTLHVDDDQLS